MKSRAWFQKRLRQHLFLRSSASWCSSWVLRYRCRWCSVLYWVKTMHDAMTSFAIAQVLLASFQRIQTGKLPARLISCRCLVRMNRASAEVFIPFWNAMDSNFSPNCLLIRRCRDWSKFSFDVCIDDSFYCIFGSAIAVADLHTYWSEASQLQHQFFQ